MAITNMQWKGKLISALVVTLLAACSTLAPSADSTAAPLEQQATGAELWANNCQRCHNFRDPTSLSDAQWDVAVMHMRIRANLTADEYRGILKYLKSSN